MDPNVNTIAGFELKYFLLAFIILSCFIFVLYWLWTWPCGENKETKYNILPDETVSPLYALEIEPGIVVLQSEDGEFFRILREYDSVERRGRGSTERDGPSTQSDNPHYMPSYTRAHFQTRSSAPLMGNDGITNDSDVTSSYPAQLDPFGDELTTWRPIHTLGPDP